jgi:DNA-binding CsgD family transcriptional regulator
LAEKLFDSCFRDAAFGVLIMDSKQTIIKSNYCAHRYCRDLYRTLFHNVNAVLSESEKTDLFIENYVINQFRKQLLSNNDHIIVPANNQLYEFWTSPFVSRDENFDKVILNYTLFIFRSSHVTSEDRLDYSNIKQKLTDREWEIAVLISQGLTNTAIAEKTFISLNTVKTHIQHIYEKLNVPNRVSLMRLLSEESKVQF